MSILKRLEILNSQYPCQHRIIVNQTGIKCLSENIYKSDNNLVDISFCEYCAKNYPYRNMPAELAKSSENDQMLKVVVENGVRKVVLNNNIKFGHVMPAQENVKFEISHKNMETVANELTAELVVKEISYSKLKKKIKRIKCKHMGEKTGEFVDCVACSGKRKVPVYKCELFEKCCFDSNAPYNIKSCYRCTEYNPVDDEIIVPEESFFIKQTSSDTNINVGGIVAFTPKYKNLKWYSSEDLVTGAKSLLENVLHSGYKFDAVIGVSRSGVIPATVIACLAHTPLYIIGLAPDDPSKFIISKVGGGSRTIKDRKFIPFLEKSQNYLLVDDTVYSGRAMNNLKKALKNYNVKYSAVIVKSTAVSIVDYYALTEDIHILEWNLFNNSPLRGFAVDKELFRNGVGVDMDGILCYDPEPGVLPNTNREKYEEFLINAKPRYFKTNRYAIPAIITGRYERYRQNTIDWLNKYNIKFDKLIMQEDNSPIDDEHIARFKSKHIIELGLGVYIESNKYQARRISELTKAAVVHPESKLIFYNA